MEGGTEKRGASTEGLPDDSNPEQLTFDENSNWFAHPTVTGWCISLIGPMKSKAIKDSTPVFLAGRAQSMYLRGVQTAKRLPLLAT